MRCARACATLLLLVTAGCSEQGRRHPTGTAYETPNPLYEPLPKRYYVAWPFSLFIPTR